MDQKFDVGAVSPRNTLVLVRLFKKKDEKIGALVVPTDSNEYAEAVILKVGPGSTPMSEGHEAETRDLLAGQRVLVKHKKKYTRPVDGGAMCSYADDGIKMRHSDDGEGEYYLFEQTNIIAILAQPEP